MNPIETLEGDVRRECLPDGSIRYWLGKEDIKSLGWVGVVLGFVFGILCLGVAFFVFTQIVLEPIQELRQGASSIGPWMAAGLGSVFVVLVGCFGLFLLFIGVISLGIIPNRPRIDLKRDRLTVSFWQSAPTQSIRLIRLRPHISSLFLGPIASNDEDTSSPKRCDVLLLSADNRLLIELREEIPELHARSFALQFAEDFQRVVGGEPLRIEQSSRVPQPAKTTLEISRSASGITLIAQPPGIWKTGKSSLVGSLFLFGIGVWMPLARLCGSSVRTHGHDASNSEIAAFSAAFLVIGIYLLVSTWLDGRRQTIFIVAAGTLAITRRTVGNPKTIRWGGHELHSVQMVLVRSGKNYTVPELQIQPKSGSKISFLRGYREDELRWLADELRRELTNECNGEKHSANS